jgi:glycosyltransferase involved in cell wall biosynthesis
VNTLPIYVVSIAKNESKHVDRWFDSAKGADGLFVLDTGSTDTTVARCNQLGITVFEQVFDPWRFDVARNHLLDLLPNHDCWVVNLDLDEVLVGDWVAALRGLSVNINRPRYNYVWNWSEDGSRGLEYRGDKIVRRYSHRWKNPVHEVNVSEPGVDEVQVNIEGFEIHHHADNLKSRSSYLPLLLVSVDEDPENDRNTYYCARELFFHGEIEQSVELFKRHLSMESSKWPPERAFSMRYLAKMLPDEREVWLLRACAEYNSRECWLDLSEHYYNKMHWAGCYFAADKCLTLTNKDGFYLNEAHCWGARPFDLAAISAFYLGMYETALEYGVEALKLEPEDKRLLNNISFYERKVTL